MKKTKVVLLDDIDGATADQTVAFAINGINYEIDLTDAHAGQLADDFAKWEAHARRVGGRSSRSTSRRSTRSEPTVDSAKVREWANANGVEVSDRGRISSAVIAQYEAANA